MISELNLVDHKNFEEVKNKNIMSFIANEDKAKRDKKF